MNDSLKSKKPKKGLVNILKLYKYMRPFQVEYFFGMFFLIGASLASLAFPKLLGELVNAGNRGNIGNELNRIALFLLLILVVQAVFAFFRTVLFVNVTEKALAYLRQSTYNHLIRLPLKFFEQRRVGELNSRISTDITLLQETLTSTFAEFVRQIIIITGGITLLLFTSLKLTLFMLAVLPGMILLIGFFGRFIRRFSKKVQEKLADSNTLVEETLQGIQSVKTYTNEFLEILKYKNKTEEISRIGMRIGKFRGTFSALIILGLFGAMVAVIWRGSILLADKKINAGELFSFVIYSGFIGGTIGGLANVIARMQKFIGATEDLFKIFEVEHEEIEELTGLRRDELISGRVSFDSLSFAYPQRADELVLNNINFTIEENQLIALVGASGSGKTTIASLLLRLHEPTKGKILFDDRESTDFSLSVLRHQIALVPQDIFLFGGSIRENISYGKPGASDDEINRAAKKAHVLEFMDRFPEGIETIVGERGTQLSGGQRQRIAIARAILKDPKILILDEATSSLDSESERYVQDALEKLMQGRTSIVIAHRLSTVRRADQIFVLDKGNIVERGTHNELLEIEKGIYKNLSELQYSV